MHTVEFDQKSGKWRVVIYSPTRGTVRWAETFETAAAWCSYLNGGAKPVKTVSLDPFEGVSTEAIFDELRSRGAIPDISKD